MALMVLPEDLPLPTPPASGRRLIVTGAYTGREPRADGRPKPVGLFIADGRIINRNLARMDGVLLVPPGGDAPRIFHRRAVRLEGESYDLTDLRRRRAFIAAAAARRFSVMQSHLLIAAGRLDVVETRDAPRALRRLLFFDAAGFGVYETTLPETLHEAAREIAGARAPSMVINLDMGTYDFCRLAEDGAERDCGTVRGEAIGKLSNLLLLEAR